MKNEPLDIRFRQFLKHDYAREVLYYAPSCKYRYVKSIEVFLYQDSITTPLDDITYQHPTNVLCNIFSSNHEFFGEIQNMRVHDGISSSSSLHMQNKGIGTAMLTLLRNQMENNGVSQIRSKIISESGLRLIHKVFNHSSSYFLTDWNIGQINFDHALSSLHSHQTSLIFNQITLLQK